MARWVRRGRGATPKSCWLERDGTSKERRRNRGGDSYDAPVCSPARGSLPEPPSPSAVSGLALEVTHTRHSGSRRRPSSYLLLLSPSSAVETSGFPGPSTTASPLLQYQTKRPLPRTLPRASVDRKPPANHVPPSEFRTPSTASSASLSRAFCIPLRTWGSPRCTLFAPPPKWLVHLRDSRVAFSLRRTPLTDVRTLSPGPFPPCRQASSVNDLVRSFGAAVAVDSTFVDPAPRRGEPRVPYRNPACAESSNLRREPRAPTSRLCSICESVS